MDQDTIDRLSEIAAIYDDIRKEGATYTAEYTDIIQKLEKIAQILTTKLYKEITNG